MNDIEFNDATIRIGSHVQKQSSLCKTVFRVLTWKINCGQVYLGSSRGFFMVRAEDKDVSMTKKLVEYSLFNMYVHSNLVHNLNGGTHIDNIDDYIKNSKTEKQKEKYLLEKERIPINFQKTINGLIAELDLCASAFGTGVVVHIGSGENKVKAIKRIAETIETVLSTKIKNKDETKRRVILENAAGEGNKIGSNLKEIKDILDFIDKKYHFQISICIDTCHLHAAGEYDIEQCSETERFLNDFKKLFGLEKLGLIHLNDAKGTFGSKKDRHEIIGDGYIYKSEEGQKSLKYLINFCNKHKIDMILETPDERHIDELNLIYSF